MEPTPKLKFETVDEYIAAFPPEIAERLSQIRATVIKAAPDAKELISYSMPALKQEGMLIFYSAWKEHIGIYPVPEGDEAFNKKVAQYRDGKGTLKFPHTQPLPFDFITEVVHLRLLDNLAKAELKKAKKKK